MAFKYQDTLNGVVAIIFVIVVGFLAVATRVMQREYLRELNLFVFKFALPALVVRGLGLKIDLYQSRIWKVIGAFVLLRTFTLLGSVAVGLSTRGGPGDVVAHWMASTWVSSIILGVPVLIATLGPSQAQLGLLAAISSFIFQLPAMLFLLELHCWIREHRADPESIPEPEEDKVLDLPHVEVPGSSPQDHHLQITSVFSFPPGVIPAPPLEPTGHQEGTAISGPPPDSSSSPDVATSRVPAQGSGSSVPRGGVPGAGVSAQGAATWRHHGFSWRLRGGTPQQPGWWAKEGLALGCRLLRNHVLWGIFIGFVLSLSTVGPKFLDPGTLPAQPNKRAVGGLAWLDEALNSLGQCTTPVALFTTGMWLCSRQALGNKHDAFQAALYLLAKFVAVPGLMVAINFICGLQGSTARGAVLVAALPISDAAFAIMQEFGVRPNVMAQQVTLQTILLLPVLLGWLGFMDAVHLFPVPA